MQLLGRIRQLSLFSQLITYMERIPQLEVMGTLTPQGGGRVLCRRRRGGWSRKRPGQSLGHFSPDTWAPTGIPSCCPPPPLLTPSPSFLMSQPRHPPGHASKRLSVVLDLRVSVRPPCLPLSPPFLPTLSLLPVWSASGGLY